MNSIVRYDCSQYVQEGTDPMQVTLVFITKCEYQNDVGYRMPFENANSQICTIDAYCDKKDPITGLFTIHLGEARDIGMYFAEDGTTLVPPQHLPEPATGFVIGFAVSLLITFSILRWKR